MIWVEKSSSECQNCRKPAKHVIKISTGDNKRTSQSIRLCISCMGLLRDQLEITRFVNITEEMKETING